MKRRELIQTMAGIMAVSALAPVIPAGFCQSTAGSFGLTTADHAMHPHSSMSMAGRASERSTSNNI
jgi:hypothetical protein